MSSQNGEYVDPTEQSGPPVMTLLAAKNNPSPTPPSTSSRNVKILVKPSSKLPSCSKYTCPARKEKEAKRSKISCNAKRTQERIGPSYSKQTTKIKLPLPNYQESRIAARDVAPMQMQSPVDYRQYRPEQFLPQGYSGTSQPSPCGNMGPCATSSYSYYDQPRFSPQHEDSPSSPPLFTTPHQYAYPQPGPPIYQTEISSPTRTSPQPGPSHYQREILSPTRTPPQPGPSAYRREMFPSARTPPQAGPSTIRSPTKTPPTPPSPFSMPSSPKSPIRLDISVSVPSGPADLDTIQQLIDEENEDSILVQMVTSPLEEKLQKMRMKSKSNRPLEETLEQSVPGKEDFMLTSDIVAALMNSEEKGIIDTKQSPKQLYETLFSSLIDEELVGVSSVAPAPLHDIVVPVGGAQTENLAVVEPDLTQMSADLPAGDAYTKNIVQMTSDEKSLKKLEKDRKKKEKEREEWKKRHSRDKKKKPEIYISGYELEEQKAPWDIVDIGSLEDLVGGQMSILLSAEEMKPDEESIRVTTETLEFVLNWEPPQHYSRVQLRGETPAWFPGFYSVFPNVPNYVQLERTPSVPMKTAWNLFAPHTIQNDCEIIIV